MVLLKRPQEITKLQIGNKEMAIHFQVLQIQHTLHLKVMCCFGKKKAMSSPLLWFVIYSAKSLCTSENLHNICLVLNFCTQWWQLNLRLSSTGKTSLLPGVTIKGLVQTCHSAIWTVADSIPWVVHHHCSGMSQLMTWQGYKPVKMWTITEKILKHQKR